MTMEQYECLKCGCVYDECNCEDKNDRRKRIKGKKEKKQ